MNSSVVLNVLYGYFDVKKDKLKWTGSLEDLKAFVLTVIDEETAETTTWRSPSGGKWVFESKPLVVTWQTKSENIYFEGEKSTALEEQVKAHIESKLESGNAEQMSDSEQQQQSVDDSTFSSRGEPDTSVSSDIHIKENDAGRRESNETFWASNNEKYIANEAVQCEEAIPNVIEKIPANSRSIQDDQMLSLEALQSQIQALTKEVNGNTAALENIREPKMDSNPLLVQESKNEVDCLKEKIYKLMDENKLLKNENNENIERINNLSFILADLQQKTKNAEQERDSVITAMRLLIAETNSIVENNVIEQKLCNEVDECTQSKDIINPNIKLKNKYSVLENEQVDGGESSAISNQKTEEDQVQQKKKRKSKSKKKTTKDDASRKPQEVEQEQQPQQQKRKTVVVAGDSIIKYVKGWELSNTEQNVAVKSFSGATLEDMNDFLRPTTRRQPDKLVIHVAQIIYEVRRRRMLLTKLLKWHTSSNRNRRKQE